MEQTVHNNQISNFSKLSNIKETNTKFNTHSSPPQSHLPQSYK